MQHVNASEADLVAHSEDHFHGDPSPFTGSGTGRNDDADLTVPDIEQQKLMRHARTLADLAATEFTAETNAMLLELTLHIHQSVFKLQQFA